MRSRSVSYIVPIALVAAWELSMRSDLFPAALAAPPSAVLARLFELTRQGVLPAHLALSLGRLMGGILGGVILGVFSGLILASFSLPDRLLTPTVQFLAGVPVVVWMPVWIVIFGTGEIFKVGLSATVTFFLVHLHVYQAVKVVGYRYLELARIYEKTWSARNIHVILPSAIPSILTALRISMAIGWVIIFFVEYAASRAGSGGLGWFVADARQVGRVEDEFAGLLLLGLVGFGVDTVIAAGERWTSAWKEVAENIEVRG